MIMNDNTKNDQPLVSIIVPVYNTEKYLKRCIDSLLAQTYRNLEIILVDDGSTDDSLEIAESYAKADERVRAVSVSHGGVSVARNHGLSLSSADLVMFADGDDWMGKDAIAHMMEVMRDTGADIVTCKIKRAFDTSETMNDQPFEYTICDQEEYIRLFFRIGSNEWVHYPVAKIYRKKFLPNPLFPPGIRIGEDVLGTYLAIKSVQKIARLSEKGYYYFYNPSGVTDYFDDRDFDLLDVWDQVVEAAKGKEPDYSYAVLNRKRINFTLLLRLVTEVPAKERKVKYADREKQLRQELKACEKDLLNAPIVRSRKIMIFLMCHCYPLVSLMGDMFIKFSKLVGAKTAMAQKRPLS